MGRCPPSDLLHRLLTSDLVEGDRGPIEAHVESCDACQECLSRLTDDPEVGSWRGLLKGGTASPDERLPADFLRALKEARPIPRDRGIRFPGPPTGRGPLGQIGPYAITSEIGAGTTGHVYLAHDTRISRDVAIKVLRPEWAAVQRSRARFQREARLSASIRHANVVGVLCVGGADAEFPLPFIVMEYIDGETLSRYLAREGPLPAQSAAKVLRQVAIGVSLAHARRFVHRDIKSSNILLERSTGLAKLGDFGLAGAIAGEESSEERFTQEGSILGTPAYMSPEQVISSDNADARSDVYSLGIVLYEMLTGTVPFRGATRAITQQVIHRDPAPPHALNDQVPRDVESICLKCLQKEPARRYQTAMDLADDLDRWLAGKPTVARPVPAWEHGWKWLRRRPTTAALLAVSVGAIAAILLMAVVYNVKLTAALDVAAKGRDRANTQLQREGINSASRLLRQHRPEDAMQALQLVPEARRGWEWDRLRLEADLVPRPDVIVGSHGHGIVAALMSPDGGAVVTSGQDGRVIRWDGATLRPTVLEEGSWSDAVGAWRHVVKPFAEEPADALAPDCFQSLCWVEPGASLAGASLRGRGVVWTLGDPRRDVLLTHDRPLNAVAACGDGRTLLWGDSQGVLIFQDRRQGQTRRLRLGDSPVMKILPLGPEAWLVGQEDGAVSLVDARDPSVMTRRRVPQPVWDMDLDPRGRELAVACGGDRLLTFTVDSEARSLGESDAFPIPDEEGRGAVPVCAVRFSPDGRRIAAGDGQGRLWAWDREGRSLLFTRAGHSAAAVRPEWPSLLRRTISSVLFSPGGEALYTAGHPTSLKRWELKAARGITSFRAGAGPKARFDPSDPALLWLADDAGALSVWESRTGQRRSVASAHAGPIRGLDLAPAAGLAATGGGDGDIRFWARRAGSLQEALPPIRHGRGLRAIAISPDGSRIAAYDEDDRVGLWDVRSGRRMGRVWLGGEGPRAVHALLAFNADASRLAVCGPGSGLWILSGQTLETMDRPYVVAGDGGTALAWHPRDTNRLIGGDTLGRVATSPVTREPFLIEHFSTHPVTAVAFNADGGRFAAAYGDGSLCVFDPRWIGKVLALRSAHAHPTGLQFDPSGKRLAVTHRGGEVDVWETGDRTVLPPEAPRRRWSSATLLEGDQAVEVTLRAPAVTFDRRDRLCLLFTKLAKGPDGAFHRLVVLGRSTGRRLDQEVLADAGDVQHQWRDNLIRSLALSAQGDDLFAAIRQRAEGVNGRLLLYRHHPQSGRRLSGPDPSWETPEALFDPMNAGADTSLLPGAAGKPDVAHFSHAGHYLMKTRWDGTRWTTERIGVKGDGYRFDAVAGADGRRHFVFKPFPFANDMQALTCLTDRGGGTSRGVIDPSHNSGAWGLTASPDGEPVVLYAVRTEGGGQRLMLARGSSGGWNKRVVSGWDARKCLSNLTCDRAGTFRVAVSDQDRNRILLLSGRGDSWQVEVVCREPESREVLDDEPRDVSVVLRLDDRERPVIAVARCSTSGGYLRVFRPEE